MCACIVLVLREIVKGIEELHLGGLPEASNFVKYAYVSLAFAYVKPLADLLQQQLLRVSEKTTPLEQVDRVVQERAGLQQIHCLVERGAALVLNASAGFIWLFIGDSNSFLYGSLLFLQLIELILAEAWNECALMALEEEF